MLLPYKKQKENNQLKFGLDRENGTELSLQNSDFLIYLCNLMV